MAAFGYGKKMKLERAPLCFTIVFVGMFTHMDAHDLLIKSTFSGINEKPLIPVLISYHI